MSEDIAENVPDAGRAYLASKYFCNGCAKSPLDPKDLANFIIVFWEGFDKKTGEPVIRDGVFDENNRVAILKACTSCGPKIKSLHRDYKLKPLSEMRHILLNDGPLKKMLCEIRGRIKPSWRFEIGWEMMLPLLEKMKADKIAKQRLH